MEGKGQVESNYLLFRKYEGNVSIQMQINFDQARDDNDNNWTYHSVNN